MDDTRKRPAPNADTEDPRGADIGQGYPEENQPGTSPGPAPDRSGGGEHDGAGGVEQGDADPGTATGNPGAAGGD